MLKIIIIHAKDDMTGLFVVIKPQDKNKDQSSRLYVYIYIYTYTYIYILRSCDRAS